MKEPAIPQAVYAVIDAELPLFFLLLRFTHPLIQTINLSTRTLIFRHSSQSALTDSALEHSHSYNLYQASHPDTRPIRPFDLLRFSTFDTSLHAIFLPCQGESTLSLFISALMRS